jgi:hypothetical protein
MDGNTDTIEVDRATADALKARAAERGISVPELLKEIVSGGEPAAVDAADIAELDRRWGKVAEGRPATAHQDVVRWLATWGTPGFRPWRER